MPTPALTWLETTSSSHPTHLLIALHGMGTTGQDLQPLADAFQLPNTRFIFPTAPLAMGAHAYQWYELSDPGRHIPQSVAQLHHLVAQLHEHYGPLPTILLGFSQGAVMTLEAGLTLQPRPIALVALSGYLYRLPDLGAPPYPPVLVAHGLRDQVVAVEFGRKIPPMLGASGVQVTYREFPIGHGISLEVVETVRTFLLPLVNMPASVPPCATRAEP
ncbi:alpha/beta hydrolase [Anthocerotibacter panamensis]|uniref:alpha/beta hydrolase n=1 Tax=Anthocerotibacter panamensis TaxID=2857077 RepID=UPI001C40274A|nr:hypothetical protein [Anthocerotibacter panamensis]